MEIKTCEEYVLNELQLTQNKLVEAQLELKEMRQCLVDTARDLENTVRDLNDLKDVIRAISKYHESEYETFIELPHWLRRDRDAAFEMLINLVPGIKNKKSN